MFGAALAPDPVRIRRWRWWPFQPRHITMAPMGHLHFPPGSAAWCACFGESSIPMQAFFLHEMTHVWQAQTRGRWYLPLMRHPFCRYDYVIEPGQPFDRYGIEQQAEIVGHAHLLRHGVTVPGKPGLEAYEALLPFREKGKGGVTHTHYYPTSRI
ncbi:vgr related protein [Sphingobium sufflavum]|uniref:vgr related protein n=1 Tax=Sphingobium sufflavum TaxID=1129547 RepID=UPI001F29091C|nr:vgr related protein [Sphingobium sufflavum]MCE7795844.1 vgr related protein [Sphingobium sufflavum]